jgi:hypothetical protein
VPLFNNQNHISGFLSFASAKIPITMNPMQINHSKAPRFSRFMPLDWTQSNPKNKKPHKITPKPTHTHSLQINHPKAPKFSRFTPLDWTQSNQKKTPTRLLQKPIPTIYIPKESPLGGDSEAVVHNLKESPLAPSVWDESQCLLAQTLVVDSSLKFFWLLSVSSQRERGKAENGSK